MLRRDFLLSTGAALAAGALPASARADVPGAYDWSAMPPIDTRQHFIDWMVRARGEDPAFLGPRFDRFEWMVAVRDVFGDGKWDHSHTLGVIASQIDFTGLYRLYLRAVQYDTIWDRTERAWSNYNSQGEARWVDRTTTSATGEIRGVTGYNAGLWNSVAGRAEGLLRMAGVTTATVQLVEGSTTHATFSAIWIP